MEWPDCNSGYHHAIFNGSPSSFFYITIKTHVFYPIPLKEGIYENFRCSRVYSWCVFVSSRCVASRCTSSNGPGSGVTSQSSGAAAVTTTPACPEEARLGRGMASRYLGMAGNHDLGTAWTKYKDRPYGDVSSITMKQSCWDVETIYKQRIKCEATFKGTVDKNTLSGTWSVHQWAVRKVWTGKFSLTMAADNQSWLGDIYPIHDPSLSPRTGRAGGTHNLFLFKPVSQYQVSFPALFPSVQVRGESTEVSFVSLLGIAAYYCWFIRVVLYCYQITRFLTHSPIKSLYEK